jgi:hypothetical protein
MLATNLLFQKHNRKSTTNKNVGNIFVGTLHKAFSNAAQMAKP